MDSLTYWWKRFQNLREMLRDYREKHKLKDVEECIERLLEMAEIYREKRR